MQSVCVFCSSSNSVDESFLEAARAMGRGIAERGWTLVFGGTDMGSMAATARGAKAAGGEVVGVIPKIYAGAGFNGADEMIVTSGLRERKEEMAARADAFVVLPGGFGTLDEAFEVIALRLLKEHDKPVVFVNVAGYYDALRGFLDGMIAAGFAKPKHRQAYHFAASIEEALSYLDTQEG